MGIDLYAALPLSSQSREHLSASCKPILSQLRGVSRTNSCEAVLYHEVLKSSLHGGISNQFDIPHSIAFHEFLTSRRHLV